MNNQVNLANPSFMPRQTIILSESIHKDIEELDKMGNLAPYYQKVRDLLLQLDKITIDKNGTRM